MARVSVIDAIPRGFRLTNCLALADGCGIAHSTHRHHHLHSRVLPAQQVSQRGQREVGATTDARSTLRKMLTPSGFDWKREEVAALCECAGARRLDAFGSAVRGDFNPATSDLDFLVEFDDFAPTAYANAYFRLKVGLESLFGRPVDLVTNTSVSNPYFMQRIMACRTTVYAR